VKALITDVHKDVYFLSFTGVVSAERVYKTAGFDVLRKEAFFLRRSNQHLRRASCTGMNICDFIAYIRVPNDLLFIDEDG